MSGVQVLQGALLIFKCARKATMTKNEVKDLKDKAKDTSEIESKSSLTDFFKQTKAEAVI